MLRWLGRKGWQKDAIETPKEFLTRIEDPAMRKRLEDFTRAYEAAFQSRMTQLEIVRHRVALASEQQHLRPRPLDDRSNRDTSVDIAGDFECGRAARTASPV